MTTRDDVIDVLKSIVDPELYIDIWTLGLIYDVDLKEDSLDIRMTFTSIACPAGPELVEEVKQKTEVLPGVKTTNVEVVFEPPWQPSEELKAMLGIG
jgi:metal-sulfur cluster biosynthetic enzyme